MRVLIFATAVLASAAAAPSGALLAGAYSHGFLGHAGPLAVAHGAPLALAHAAPLAVAHAAPLAIAHAAPLAVAHAIAPAAPTISPGDLQGAAIDAHVDAADHVRAAVDATRELHDQAAEIQGQAINAAEDHSWQAVDAVKTAEAQLDGAAAGVAPVLAKQLVGHAAPVVAAHGAYLAGPAAYAAGPVGYAAGGLVAGHAAYAAAPALAASKTVVSQSLSQTHPGAVVAHAPIAYAAHGLAGHGYAAHGLAGHGYAAHGLAAHGYAAHGLAAHGLAHHAW